MNDNSSCPKCGYVIVKPSEYKCPRCRWEPYDDADVDIDVEEAD